MDGWIAGRATHQHKYTDPDERSLIRSPSRCVHNPKMIMFTRFTHASIHRSTQSHRFLHWDARALSSHLPTLVCSSAPSCRVAFSRKHFPAIASHTGLLVQCVFMRARRSKTWSVSFRRLCQPRMCTCPCDEFVYACMHA